MHELALFAGAGGGILGGTLLGWRTVCAVEIDRYAASVLVARQNNGQLPPFPVWDDVRTFDGRPWRGIVDVISGGFPCQDISAAGKGAGLEGERSGLWADMARIIREVRPRFVFVENSPMLVARGLGQVLGDLAALGYDATWGVFSACSVGAPHTRERLFVLADAYHEHEARMGHRERSQPYDWSPEIWGASQDEHTERYFDVRLETEPASVGVAHGMANRVDQIRAIGNGQVPAVAAFAWEVLR